MVPASKKASFVISLVALRTSSESLTKSLCSSMAPNEELSSDFILEYEKIASSLFSCVFILFKEIICLCR